MSCQPGLSIDANHGHAVFQLRQDRLGQDHAGVAASRPNMAPRSSARTNGWCAWRPRSRVSTTFVIPGAPAARSLVRPACRSACCGSAPRCCSIVPPTRRTTGLGCGRCSKPRMLTMSCIYVPSMRPTTCARRGLRVAERDQAGGPLFGGYVPEAIFDPVTLPLVPLAEAEGFNVIRHLRSSTWSGAWGWMFGGNNDLFRRQRLHPGLSAPHRPARLRSARR